MAVGTWTPVNRDRWTMYELWELTGVAAGETIPWLNLDPRFTDRTVFHYGTFGGTVTWKGTAIEADDATTPVAEFSLKGTDHNAISGTAVGGAAVVDGAMAIRPSAGAGVANVTARVLAIRRF